jgi:uncharacterized protein YeaO (DUF488 family)
MLKTKSVASPIERPADGLRILVARFRGRGLPVDRYDVWMPNLGPSERLLTAFQAERISWTQFRRAYRDEIYLDGAIDARSRTIKNHGQKFTLRLLARLAHSGTVTLLCHCAEHEQHCHRHVLQKLILSS